METLWQQVSSDLQDFSKNSIFLMFWSGWLRFFFLSLVGSVFLPLLGDRSKGSNYNWYHRHLLVSQLFQPSGKIQVSIQLFAFFHFHSLVPWKCKIHSMVNSSLFNLNLNWLSCLNWVFGFYQKGQENVLRHIFSGRFGLRFSNAKILRFNQEPNTYGTLKCPASEENYEC